MPRRAVHPIARALRLLGDDMRLHILLALGKAFPGFVSGPRMAAELGVDYNTAALAFADLKKAGLAERDMSFSRKRHTQWRLTSRVQVSDGVLMVELEGFTLTIARAKQTTQRAD